MTMEFFDIESLKNLDEKLRVLRLLKDGTLEFGSAEHLDILELYPKNEEIWDTY